MRGRHYLKRISFRIENIEPREQGQWLENPPRMRGRHYPRPLTGGQPLSSAQLWRTTARLYGGRIPSSTHTGTVHRDSLNHLFLQTLEFDLRMCTRDRLESIIFKQLIAESHYFMQLRLGTNIDAGYQRFNKTDQNF
jgi:hypothetical protein